jgi:hypothetical protein
LLEADRLGNEEFFPWYAVNVFRCEALSRLMEKKMQCRDRGFDVDLVEVRRLAVEYLVGLKSHLVQALTVGDNS